MMMAVLKDLRIPIRSGRVHYYETFSACIKRVTALSGFEEDVDAEEEEKAAQRCIRSSFATVTAKATSGIGVRLRASTLYSDPAFAFLWLLWSLNQSRGYSSSRYGRSTHS